MHKCQNFDLNFAADNKCMEFWQSLICSAKFCSINLMFSDTYRWFSVLINIDGVIVLLKASSSSSIRRHVYFVLCVNWYLYGLIVVGYFCFCANWWTIIQPVYVQHLVLYRKIRTGICKRIMVEITSKTFVQSFHRKYWYKYILLLLAQIFMNEYQPFPSRKAVFSKGLSTPYYGAQL